MSAPVRLVDLSAAQRRLVLALLAAQPTKKPGRVCETSRPGKGDRDGALDPHAA